MKKRDKKTKKNKKNQKTNQYEGLSNQGIYKPGPWPEGKRPDLVNHPMPGRIPAGWPHGKPVEVLKFQTEEAASDKTP